MANDQAAKARAFAELHVPGAPDSLGSAIAQAAYAVAARAAAEMLISGTYQSVADGLDYATLNAGMNHKSF
jgi:hypothetical protein